MRTDSAGRPETSKLRVRGKRRPERRPRRERGCEPRRHESGRRPSALTRAEIDGRWIPLHVDLHYRPDFDQAVKFEDRTALRELDRVRQIAGLDDRVAADQILALCVRPVGDRLALAFDNATAGFQRLARVLEVTAVAELL